MKNLKFVFAGLGVAAAALAGIVFANDEARERPDAEALLKACREGLPLNQVTLAGRLFHGKPRGFGKTDKFALSIDWSADPAVAVCVLNDAKGGLLERVEMTRPRGGDAVIRRFSGIPLKEQESPSLGSRVAETDLLWLDLTMDFLWWPAAVYDNSPETNRKVLGRACEVILASPPKPIPGLSAVRIWIDKQTGFLMKAEKLNLAGEPVRYFWVQRVKKFDNDVWMIREIKAQARGSRYQTQLIVDTLNNEALGDKEDAFDDGGDSE